MLKQKNPLGRLFVLTTALLVVALASGCGKEEKKKAQPQSFEDFAKSVVATPPPPPPQEAEPEDNRELKIGIIGPLTGEEASIGKATFSGADLAADTFNSSGGVSGKPIEKIEFDNKGSSGITTKGLEGFYKQGVVAVIGAPTGWSTFTPVYFANESKTVFISAGTRRHIGTSGSFVFRMSLPGELAAKDLLEYGMKKDNMKDYFLVTVMEDEALNIASAFRRAADKIGAKVKGEGSLFSASDIPDAVKALKASMPVDAVIFAGNSPMALDFLRQAKKSGIRVPIVGGEELYDGELLKGGSLVKGSIVYSGFSLIDDNPATKDFIKRYKKKNGKPPDEFAAEGYDAFMFLAKAIKDSGSTDPSKVKKSMMAIKDFQGVGGTLTMGEDREAVKHPYLLKVVDAGKSYKFSIVSSPHSK